MNTLNTQLVRRGLIMFSKYLEKETDLRVYSKPYAVPEAFITDGLTFYETPMLVGEEPHWLIVAAHIEDGTVKIRGLELLIFYETRRWEADIIRTKLQSAIPLIPVKVKCSPELIWRQFMKIIKYKTKGEQNNQ